MKIILEQNMIECLGWTLVHFIWQGAVIAALFAVSLRVLRNSAPQRRYLAGCLALLMMAAAPAVTLPIVIRQSQHARILLLPATSQNAVTILPPAANIPIFAEKQPNSDGFFVSIRKMVSNIALRAEKYLPSFVFGWAVGVVVLSLRLLAGWLQIKRLKRSATIYRDEILLRKLEELSRRLALSRPVRLLQSALVEVPTVIGWLRPIILLPASCLAGLTPAQLESILAHELAHIRRHDYFINLLQSAIETILFYHPAVWWISRRVREEREHCCDDLAVEICGDRAMYARALATLEELRVAPAQLAMAATGAPLLPRIRRLAGKSVGVNRPAWPLAGIVLLAIFASLAFSLRGNVAQARDDQSQNPLAQPLSPPPQQPLAAKRPYAPARHTSGSDAIRAKLDAIHVDTIQYEGFPLSEVIKNLIEISRSQDTTGKGINFLVDRQSSTPGPASIDPATGLPVAAELTDINSVSITISPPLRDLRMSDALDAIVHSADHPITYTVLDYAVMFRFGDGMETRTYHVDPNTFQQGLSGVTGAPFGNPSTGNGGNGGGSNGGGGAANGGQNGVVVPHVNPTALPGVTTGADTSSAGQNGGVVSASTQKQVREFLSSLGMDVSADNVANIGKTFVWNNRTGTLIIRATPNELDNVGSALSALKNDNLEVNLKARVIEGPDLTNLSFPNGPAQGPLTGILTPLNFKKSVEAFEQRDNVDELILPEVTAESGREVQMPSPPAKDYSTTLNIIASVLPDNHSLSITLSPDIAGWKTSCNVTVQDGQTVVLAGMKLTNSVGVTNDLVIFVTPTIINPDGTRLKTSEYADVIELIEQLQKAYYDARGKYPEHSPIVKDLAEKLEKARAEKKDLEKAEPSLVK